MKKQNKFISFLKEPAVLVGLFFMLLILMSDGVSASIGELKPQQVNTDITLPQFSDSATFQNISSVLLGNGTLVILNAEMTKSGYDFYYTLDSSYVQSLGRYCVNGYGNDADDTTWNYCFQVTADGSAQSTSQGLGSAMFLFLMLVLMFTFGVLGYKLFKNQNLWVLGIFFMFLSLLFLVYNTWLGYQYHRLFTGLPDSSIPITIFYIFMLVLVLGLLVSLALLFLRWKEVFRYIKREIKRKESSKEEEDWDIDEWGGENWKLNK